MPNLSPAALLLISSLSALPLQGAVACSPLPGPPIERYRNVRVLANSIFIGRVEHLTSIEEPIPNAGSTLEVLVASIATTNTIEGVKASKHQLRTPKSSAACGVPIFEKETYLFAAKGDQVVMAIPTKAIWRRRRRSPRPYWIFPCAPCFSLFWMLVSHHKRATTAVIWQSVWGHRNSFGSGAVVGETPRWRTSARCSLRKAGTRRRK